MNRNERTTRLLLGVIAFLLAANLLTHMNQGSSLLAAGAPGSSLDDGARAQAQIDQLTDLNKKIDRLQSYLESGSLTVKVKDDKPAK